MTIDSLLVLYISQNIYLNMYHIKYGFELVPIILLGHRHKQKQRTSPEPQFSRPTEMRQRSQILE